MLPSSLTVLVEMAAQLAWPVTQALFHSLWIGVLVAACLWLLERFSGRSGQTDQAEPRPELAARLRFNFSLTALVLVAASLPLSFFLVFDRTAFEEAIVAPGHAGDAVSESSANLLDAKPIAQVLEGARPAEGPEGGSLAEPATEASQTDAWNDSELPRLMAGARRFAPVIAVLYGLGVLVMLLRLAVGICGGRRLAKSGRRLSDSALMASLNSQATRLGVKLRPLVSTCERVAVPVVVGVVRPVILLPASLLSGLAPEDVETILAHELAHLRRRDHLTVLVQRALEAVLFYHPIAWWLSRRIDAFCEDACDDLVLASGIDRMGYATTLLRVAELRTNAAEERRLLSQLAVDGGHPSKLRRRIERIVESSPDPGVRVRQSRFGLALLTVCLALVASLLVQVPVQSQTSSAPEVATRDENAGDNAADSAAARPESPSAEGSTTSNEPDPIRQKLSSRTDFRSEEMPLLEVLDFVERESGVPITISLGECMLRGVDGHSPVTLAVKDATFVELLSQATLALNLSFEITPDGIRIPAKTPAFEFRIVPELPASNASVRLPEGWKENTYRDGTGGETNVGQHPGFAWFPAQLSKGLVNPPPAMESRGTGQIALLSDDAQHIMTPDGRWHVQEVRLEDAPGGQRQLAVTIDEAGGARMRKLSRAAMNQKIAMLVHGVVVMAPTVRSEIGEKFIIAGGFSDEQWRLIEKSVKQAMLPPGDEFSFDCDIRDKYSSKPVAGAQVRWTVLRIGSSRKEDSIFDQRFTTDEQGRFQVTMSRDVYEHAKRRTVYEVIHPDYIEQKDYGAPLLLPDAPESLFDLRHLKLTPGTVVTGRFLNPDGTPAANLRIMVGRNRASTGSRRVISHTDEDGRFRVVTTAQWPKRLHWYPDEFVSDSIAIRKKMKGEKPVPFVDASPLHLKTIRLKHGPRISGVVLDLEGNPLANTSLRAVTGTRVPIRSATTGKDGHFSFPPLPPLKEYEVTVIGPEATRPFRLLKVNLPVNGNPQPLTFRHAPSRQLIIVATDQNGRPATEKRFSVTVSPYSTTPSEHDESGRGTYHVWIPNDASHCRLATAFVPGSVACWQLTQNGPVVSGNSVYLKDAAEQRGPLFVQFRQAARIRVTVKAGARIVPSNDSRVSVNYARIDQEGSLRPFERSLAVRGRSDDAVHYIDGIAPGEDVVIDASIKGALQQRTTIRLAAGETRYLTIDLAALDDADTDRVTSSAPEQEQDSAASPTLTVKYDMPGSSKEARIFVERTGGTEGEIGLRGDGVMKWTPLTNGASFDLKELIPGDYQVARMRQLEIVIEKDAKDAERAQRIQTTVLLDRHRFKLKAGQQKTIDLSRRGGQRVAGMVERAPDLKPARMLLYVCSPEADGVDALHSLETTIFDARECDDGEFTTDQLEPGEYSLLAVGYDAWPREAFFQTGLPRPG